MRLEGAIERCDMLTSASRKVLESIPEWQELKGLAGGCDITRWYCDVLDNGALVFYASVDFMDGDRYATSIARIGGGELERLEATRIHSRLKASIMEACISALELIREGQE